MKKLDPSALTPDELEGGVTKLRYMRYRDDTSSSRTLGWRIEGVRHGEESYEVPARKIGTREQACAAIAWFVNGNAPVHAAVLERLTELRSALEASEWFRRHEVVASSLLFVYDCDPAEGSGGGSPGGSGPPGGSAPPGTPTARVFMIDFAKTTTLSELTLSHRAPWVMGNHEDVRPRSPPAYQSRVRDPWVETLGVWV